jgi:hypothetical protein
MELERVLLMGGDTAWMALAKENLALACWLLLVPNGEFFFWGGAPNFAVDSCLPFLEKYMIFWLYDLLLDLDAGNR